MNRVSSSSLPKRLATQLWNHSGRAPYGHEVTLIKKILPFRPYTGVFVFDLIMLSLIAAIDQHILPSILGPLIGDSLTLNILLIWIVVVFIVAPPGSAFAHWLMAGIFLELSSNAPKGVYFCSMWILYSILILLRKSISWRAPLPWFVTFFLTTFFIGHIESLVIFLKQDSRQLDFMYFFKQAITTIMTCFAGFFFCVYWMKNYKGDPVKERQSV